MNFEKVCVILPCFNESLTLPSMVQQIQNISSEIEILIVDNLSTDDSFKIASNLGVKVVSKSENSFKNLEISKIKIYLHRIILKTSFS